MLPLLLPLYWPSPYSTHPNQPPTPFHAGNDGDTFTTDSGLASSTYPAAALALVNPLSAAPIAQVTQSVVGRLGGSSSESWNIIYGVPEFLLGTSRAYLPYGPYASQGAPSVFVVGRVQYSGLVVQATQQLQNFPFDSQLIFLNITNIANGLRWNDMQFEVVSPNSTAGLTSTGTLPINGNPDGYVITGAVATVFNNTGGLSTVSIGWRLQRLPDFFVNRFVMPLCIVNVLIIALMSANPATRVMAAFTMIGTVVSFLFVAGQSVPQLPYATRLDRFFLLNFVMALLAGLGNIYATNRMDRQKAHPIFSVLWCLAPKKKGEKKKSEDSKDDKKEGGGAAPLSVDIKVKVPIAEMDSTALLRSIWERKVAADKKAADKAAADKKKADEDKVKAALEADKSAAQLNVDGTVAIFLILLYLISVPCIFYA